MLEQFTVDTFTPHIGDTFRVDVGGDTPLDLRLVEASAMGDRYYRLDDARPPFSLVFAGPPALRLPQRIYAVEHDTLGRFPLFLVAIQPDNRGSLYEAVFN